VGASGAAWRSFHSGRDNRGKAGEVALMRDVFRKDAGRAELFVYYSRRPGRRGKNGGPLAPPPPWGGGGGGGGGERSPPHPQPLSPKGARGKTPCRIPGVSWYDVACRGTERAHGNRNLEGVSWRRNHRARSRGLSSASTPRR